MAYINQEMKKVIAESVKPILKKYGVKGTLSIRHHSCIALNLKSGKINFFVDGEVDPKNAYIQVNPYWYQDHFTGKSKAFLDEVIPALKSAGWYDRSDAQVDYFDTAYYFDVNVGKWNKPYVVE